MEIIPLLLKEFDEETKTTRRMLERVPADKFGWKPHPKSMSIEQLSVHIADLPSWVSMALHTTELNFATAPYEPKPVTTQEELLNMFDKSVESGRTALQQAKEEDLLPTWTLKDGDRVLAVMTKYEVIRHAFGQTAHHRAQLGADLRLLDIPIPGTYGPSADEDF